MNCIDSEIKMSKVKVIKTLSVVKNLLLGPFCDHVTSNDDSLNWIGCVMGGSAIWDKTRGAYPSSIPVKFCLVVSM